MPEQLTTEEVAAFLRLKVDTVRKLANTGKIPGARRVGRAWLFDREALIASFGPGGQQHGGSSGDDGPAEPDST